MEEDGFEPGVGCLALADHVAEFVADDRVVDKALAKGLALQRVLEGLFNADASKSAGLHDNTETFVVEVVHDILEALVQFTDQVGLWYFDLAK